MLRQRIITALILLPLAIFGILKLDSEIFALVLAAIMLVGGTEWCRMAGIKDRLQQLIFLGLLLVSLWLSWLNLGNSQFIELLLWATLGWWLLALVWVLAYPNGANIWYGNIVVRILTGLFVLVPTWFAVVYLQSQQLPLQHGPERVLFLMVLIWIADSGAFFTGRKFGRTKLAPKVSPGKSWEGVIGGTIASVVAAWLITSNFSLGLSFSATAAVGYVLIILFSVLGDLTESMYKRRAGIKDSGSILPGHGGILDRLDSLTSAAPIFLLALTQGWI